MEFTSHRKTLRLEGVDYSKGGAFFITICTHQRKMIFGDIRDSIMDLNPFGSVALEEWMKSQELRPGLILDSFVVMPNHIHGIVIIPDAMSGKGAPLCDPTVDSGGVDGGVSIARAMKMPLRKPRSLGSFVAGYKMKVCARINELRQTPRAPLWQRNYHERIIRSERELGDFREYIYANPARWELDSLHPSKWH